MTRRPGWWADLLKLLGLGAPRDETAPVIVEDRPEVEPTASLRPWTFMVYMAGDNGRVFQTQGGKIQLMAEMTSAGYADLREMGSVGTTERVAVTCMFDTPEGAYRIEVRKWNGFAQSEVESLGALNSGEAAVLSSFITQSVRRYPAQHYALILWNHGAGWLDTDAYASVRSLRRENQGHDPIFRSTVDTLARGAATRPIAFDDSSKDFLDTRDLRQALADARRATGVHLDLIGMDACLMAMVEGARELAAFAEYFVASEEVEPMAGWAYGEIVARLDRSDPVSPKELALGLVTDYARSYQGKTRFDNTVTLSAVDLTATKRTEQLCANLAAAILARGGSSQVRHAVLRARDLSLVFQDRNYRDLGDFAERLSSEAQSLGATSIQRSASALADHMRDRSAGSPVLQVAYRPSYARATGLSVYLPGYLPLKQREETLKIYRPLAFADRTGWARLVEWILEGA